MDMAVFLVGLCALGLFVGMLAMFEVGRRIGRRHIARHGETPTAGVGAIEGAVFGLLDC